MGSRSRTMVVKKPSLRASYVLLWLLCLGTFPCGGGCVLWRENPQGRVSDPKSQVCHGLLLICSLPATVIFQVTDPTGFNDLVHHPDQFNLTELFNKAWRLRGLVKHLKLFETDSIVENPYYWKSSGVHDPGGSAVPHPLWYEADRGDLLFLLEVYKLFQECSAYLCREVIQLLPLAHESIPLLFAIAFLMTFLEK